MKAAFTGYEKRPFFFDQHNEDDPRLQRTVAWAGTLELQEKLFPALIDELGERIDYLFKRNVGADEEGIKWSRLQGGIFKLDLIKIVANHREWFFGDAGFQICIRKAESMDHFAYDEHGIFWIYSNNPRFHAILEEFGFEPREDDLICELPHWHVYRKDSDTEAENFQFDLVHASVYTTDG